MSLARIRKKHRRKRKLFWTLTFFFIFFGAYNLFIYNLVAVLSMMFLAIYTQMLVKISEFEERLAEITFAYTDSNSL